ncbi:hypothetical protein BV22DRAFT_1133609 [Leucogyrophana mollusca]|uniref:Uncharacterized protein n=1 Tax=Leucogyrophana mollusca TaxID=85980 RepID=A0ACB8B4V4_9AGAM|nr:hypothetical protein BV22DRAFT_1133609 [Leucogyrophana mollusca]
MAIKMCAKNKAKDDQHEREVVEQQVTAKQAGLAHIATVEDKLAVAEVNESANPPQPKPHPRRPSHKAIEATENNTVEESVAAATESSASAPCSKGKGKLKEVVGVPGGDGDSGDNNSNAPTGKGSIKRKVSALKISDSEPDTSDNDFLANTNDILVDNNDISGDDIANDAKKMELKPPPPSQPHNTTMQQLQQPWQHSGDALHPLHKPSPAGGSVPGESWCVYVAPYFCMEIPHFNIKGALTLSATTAEYVLCLAATGNLKISDEDMDMIAAKGKGKKLVAVATTLNKSTGKESKTATGFNEGNWGTVARKYMESVNNLSDESLKAICDEAQQIAIIWRWKSLFFA